MSGQEVCRAVRQARRAHRHDSPQGTPIHLGVTSSGGDVVFEVSDIELASGAGPGREGARERRAEQTLERHAADQGRQGWREAGA